MSKMDYKDLNDPGYDISYRSGKTCQYESDCDNPAGTAWGPYVCPKCNVKRLDKIGDFFEEQEKGFAVYDEILAIAPYAIADALTKKVLPSTAELSSVYRGGGDSDFGHMISVILKSSKDDEYLELDSKPKEHIKSYIESHRSTDTKVRLYVYAEREDDFKPQKVGEVKSMTEYWQQERDIADGALQKDLWDRNDG